MGYLTYYLLWFFLAYATRYPYLAVGAVIFFLLRGFIPDPVIWLRTIGRIRRLETEVAANPANITARRDLARMYLDLLRPRRALALIEQALNRDIGRRDAELLYLKALAHYKVRDYESVLEPVVQAVDLQPNLLFGEAYMLAASTLMHLKRWEEAEDALERYLRNNSSSVKGYVMLAKVRSAAGQGAEAKKTLHEGLSTWSQLPSYKRRTEFGWWLRGQLTRIAL